MNDTALKNFATQSRTTLMRDVLAQMRRWAIDADAAVPAAADVLNGQPLTAQQREQRRALLERCAAVGEEALCEQVAYTWFNRFAAIRFMELHDYLPCHLRFFSAADDAASCKPQVLDEALNADIEGVDRVRVAELVQAGDPDALFRYLLLAQCNELAAALPAVFERVGSAMELLLPERLLREGGVIWSMVEGLDVADWDKVEVLGWLYQFYNAELKDDFFKAKRKATAADIAPATQLFTPEWIVRYMVENSLGRLWMLNHPDSLLRERMEYYIEPDAEHEDFLRVESPEEITFCDPACGSGHILSYAFKLLFYMYEEAGYRTREIPELILTKNLSGMEIDQRAAQIASLVLALRAREHDRRFFGRGVQADVCVLESVPFEEGELTCCGKPLADALTHLGEVGSLLAPTEEDLASLQAELATCEGDLFANAKAEKLKLAIEKCEKLARRFDVVVANPPYMGSSSFNPFMKSWVKKNYPEVKSDLFSSFIVRIMSFAKPSGESGIMCPFVWMFIGSYEKLRKQLVNEKTLTSLVQLEYSGFAGATVPICTFTFHNSKIDGYKGGYIRLSDFVGAAVQGPKTLEAIKNPDCGYFYRADATTFKTIPGSPIAYWASESVLKAFDGDRLCDKVPVKKGLDTGDNERFLRLWHEVSLSLFGAGFDSPASFVDADKKWAPHDKGGDYRKWYGNNDWVINWESNGAELRDSTANLRSQQFYFHTAVTWSSLSSGKPSFRHSSQGAISNTAGSSAFPESNEMGYLLAYMNSTVIAFELELLAPTLNYSAGPVGSVPAPAESNIDRVNSLAESSVDLSKTDWDSFETSWDFKRHPLL